MKTNQIKPRDRCQTTADSNKKRRQSVIQQPPTPLRSKSNADSAKAAKKRIKRVIEQLAEEGQTDSANGGVAINHITDELGCSRATAFKQAKRLVESGEVREVRGIGPNGPRLSYLPIESGDLIPDGGTQSDEKEHNIPMYCPTCDGMVPENFNRFEDD